MSPVKSYGFTQRTSKGVNEITLVLLNDVDDSHTPHLFCAHACVNGVATIFNWQTSFTGETIDSQDFFVPSIIYDETNDQEQCISTSIRKKKTNKDVQMLEHSSHNQGAVM